MKATTAAGGSPDNPEAEETIPLAANPVPPEPAAEADAEPAPRAEAAAEASARTKGGPQSEPDAEAEAETAAEGERPGAAKSRPEGRSKPRNTGDPEAGSEAKPAPAGPGNAPRPAPEADGSGNSGGPGAKPVAATPEAESPDNAGKRAAEAEGTEGSDTLGSKSSTEAEPIAAPRPKAQPEGSDNTDSHGAAPKPEAKPADKANPRPPAPEAEPAKADGADAKTRPDAEPNSGDKTTAVRRPQAGPAKADDASNSSTHAAKTRTDAEPNSGDKTTAVRRPQAGPAKADDAGSSGAPAAKTRPDAEPESGDKTMVVRRPQAGPTEADDASNSSTPAAKTRPDAEPDSGDKTMAVRRPQAWPKAKPATAAPADTGKPAATPRPDSKTPGPTSSGTPGAGIADGSRRVPSWAQGQQGQAQGPEGEGGSERTSEFVALKPLDTPAAAPAAAPPPAPATATRPTAPPATATPAAPLELLAELTNTATPPETPRRSALRRVKIWTPILLLLVVGVAGSQLLRPLPAPKIVAAETGHTVAGQLSIPWPAKGQGAIRVPGSGDIGTFGEQKPVPTASVAKVMTAYVILKNHPLKKNDPGPSITIDAKTVADGTSENESRIIGLTAGTEFSQQDMLKMLMIPSGNNVARLLARWDTGSDSEAAFVEKMNAAARELGMANTVYTDPSGLDAGTVSTASDQLKLAEAVMKDEVFRAIVAMPNAPIEGLKQPLDNNNDLLNSSIRGIKTGSSTPAGGALMWAAYKSVGDETPLVIGTLMDQRVDGPDPNATKSLKLALDNSKKIIEAVRTALASAPVVRKGDTVGYVDDGLGGRTPLVAAKDLDVVGVPGQQLKLALQPGAAPLPHTARAGAEVAVLTAGDGEGARSVPVAVGKQLAEPSFGTRLTRVG
ncbi:D-alanyl-D-alanine carboxypeptidase family protein [Streptomyces subrutilus]|uniref:D-alanyl-D-alanine carboxypeptidase family protein n=1 Tax=Streptomyces subrutilus TaxID=36818 RepID=UPI0033C1799F